MRTKQRPATLPSHHRKQTVATTSLQDMRKLQTHQCWGKCWDGWVEPKYRLTATPDIMYFLIPTSVFYSLLFTNVLYSSSLCLYWKIQCWEIQCWFVLYLLKHPFIHMLSLHSGENNVIVSKSFFKKNFDNKTESTYTFSIQYFKKSPILLLLWL